MTTALLQISDPHFGTDQPAVVAALVELSARLAPTLVVMSGDVTQRATRDEFESARAFVRRLAAPATLVLPGNHDIPLLNLALRVVAPFSRFHAAFGADSEPIHDDEALCVIGVNTVIPRWHKDGAVTSAQVARVAARLRQAKDAQLRVVVCHHPVLVIRPEDDDNLLQGGEAAVRAWSEAGADLILGGHIHLPYVRPLKERYPDLARDVWAVQAGTSVSSRIRAGNPNSVNLIRPIRIGHEPGCVVERWDFVAASASFEIVTADRLTLDRRARGARLTGPAGVAP